MIAKCCLGSRNLSRVVLVVDDEPLVREVTASMLEDLGCEVITAASGNDALEKLSGDRRIEILITDINMPGMDGYQLAERATRMRGQLRVIMLSGREANGGGFPLVRKPFLAQDLKRTMAWHTGLC
jgi:two-component system cell cycle response regulator CpdR